MRLDLYLTLNGYADSRQRAKLLITEGYVSVNAKTDVKPSMDVSDSDAVCVSGDPIGYVSRGALKLKAAFESFTVSAGEKVAIDVGASTGGFTEFLLSNGAKLVYAVDSGVNQLAAKLQNDDRVISMEKYNARNLVKDDFSPVPELAVMDVSFISQTLIIPSLAKILSPGADFISLIKPQFEAGREAVGKGGLVKSKVAHVLSIQKVIDSAKENGFEFCNLCVSPIKGGDGNTEYLAHFTFGDKGLTFDKNINILISEMVGL